MTGNSWLVVTVAVRPDADESLTHALSEQLIALGGSAVEMLPGQLRTYLPNDTDTQDPDAVDRAAAVRSALESGAASPVVVAVDVAPAADRDWLELWRTGLGARRLGERIIVAPTWVPASAATGDIIIRIDPQMAFGTGEHGTTRGMLRLLEAAMSRPWLGARAEQPARVPQNSSGTSAPAAPIESVLDIGTGSAILAIAAAKLGAGRVVAVDGDRHALENATENIARNQVLGRVQLRHLTVDAEYLGSLDSAIDLVLANILSSVIVPLLPAIASLAPRHGLIAGGILSAEAAAFLSAASDAGFALGLEDEDDEWWTGWLQLEQPVRRRSSST